MPNRGGEENVGETDLEHAEIDNRRPLAAGRRRERQRERQRHGRSHQVAADHGRQSQSFAFSAAFRPAQRQERQRPRNAAHHPDDIPCRRIRSCRRRERLAEETGDHTDRNRDEKRHVTSANRFLQQSRREQQDVERCRRLQKNRISGGRQLGREDKKRQGRSVYDADERRRSGPRNFWPEYE